MQSAIVICRSWIMSLPLWVALACLALAADPSESPDTSGVEFFESRVRPVLVEHCSECHGADKQESSLRLDHPAGIRAGGDRGATVVPGKPEQSALIQAIRYSDENFQMPPRGKLLPRQIADLTEWVRRGAPMPKASPGDVVKSPSSGFDLAERLEHWCYQPVQQPSLPAVRDRQWPVSPVDHFILARLEEASLKPAAQADRRTLIRRLSFDLTGLPPTLDEVNAFVSDTSPQAYEKLVDRLLASPHYGERWGRHWLDLVRFAETLGHEFDFEIFHAWRYRDYVIRAFDADVPYNQFVLEHLAGDLLRDPRRHPIEGFNESIIGSGFWWLGEGKHSPVDIRQEQADRIDNQIDVFGKALLAQTIACARCHDHKFDAITTADYYALAGYLKSTRYDQAIIDHPERIKTKAQQLSALRNDILELARPLLRQAFDQQRAKLPAYLLAAAKTLTGSTIEAHRIREESSLDKRILQRFVDQLEDAEKVRTGHPLYAWRQLAIEQADATASLSVRALQLRESLSTKQAQAMRTESDKTAFADFTDWMASGNAFAKTGTQPASFLVGAGASRPVAHWLRAGQVHSAELARPLEGALRSPTFRLEHPYIHLRASGRGSRINLVIDGHTLIRSPIYGGLTLAFKDERDETLAWRTIDVSMWPGHRGYLELLDCAVPNPTQPMPESASSQIPSQGYLVLDEVRFSTDPHPPGEKPCAVNLQVLADPLPSTLEQVAERYAESAASGLERALAQRALTAAGSTDATSLVNLFLELGLLDIEESVKAAGSDVPPGCETTCAQLNSAIASYFTLESTIPAPKYALAAADGSGEDECVFHRGNYRTPGERVPRRLPTAICMTDQPPPASGSGRLAMAKRLIDPANPLLARVIVNRLWHYHFGQGMVRSPDDFGHMGQAPTHPKLLDYLASELVQRGWSLKQMHRLMVVSRTYQMASRGDAAAEAADPENKLWHRMLFRRLEAEAIRDAVLAVSGQLDRTMFGPAVLPHLTPFMEGRGRPSKSGPLDGDRRRSLYINVRRNFLTPMFLAFDYPIPFSTMGRRSVSNVPAQALSMMNGRLIAEQAACWAESTLSDESLSDADRIQLLYQTAFARPASDAELKAALEFIDEQSKPTANGDKSIAAWTELCHVLLNTKEFIFLD
jgi:cytochrome c553